MNKHFIPSRLLFTRCQSCVCAAGRVWQGLERGSMNHATEDNRKSPVLVPCFLCCALAAILFLQDRFKGSFTQGLKARAVLQKLLWKQGELNQEEPPSLQSSYVPHGVSPL